MPAENQDTHYDDPTPPYVSDEGWEPVVTKETRCDHYFVQDSSQDPFTNMVSVRCMNEGCWSGASYDPEQSDLKDGKLVSKETHG